MRILYLASSPVPSDAANSVHVAHMAGAFSLHKNNVTIAAPSVTPWRRWTGKSVAESYGAIGYYRLFNVWSPRNRLGSKIYNIILRVAMCFVRPDVVYSRHLIGAKISANQGYLTVLEVHKPDWERVSRGRAFFDNLLEDPHFLGFVCISRALERYLLDNFPKAVGQTFVAPDAAPDWHLPTMKAPRSTFTVGYFGGLFPGKGLETILSVAPRCPWATFLIVGGTRNEIDHIVHSKDVPSNVVFCERQNHASVPWMMAECDVLVAPYLEKVETFGGGADVAAWMSPLKLFEYMSVGKPIVCSDLPVLREILAHEHNSLFIPPGDFAGWTRAIERLKDDKQLAERLASRALSDFRENYTWSERARRVLAWMRSRIP